MNGKPKIIRCISVAVLACSIAACGVKRPEEVLTDEKMQAVLYDYHLAKAMGDEVSYQENYKRALYVKAVFEKHGITQEQFDSSMVWFSHYPDKLAKMYEQISAQLKQERDGVNRLIAMRDNQSHASVSGDTVDVWGCERRVRLTGLPMSNKLAFCFAADTCFHERDRLVWQMDFDFIGGVPDSTHTPVMAMQMAYANDSVIQVLKHIRQTGIHSLTLQNDTLGKIKEIRGFVYYPLQSSHGVELSLDKVSLMRYHIPDSIMQMSGKAEDKGNLKRELLKPVGKPVKQ